MNNRSSRGLSNQPSYGSMETITSDELNGALQKQTGEPKASVLPFENESPCSRHRSEKVPITTRSMEILVSLAVLFFAMPIYLGVAIIIKLGTPGPTVFRQRRLGLGAEPFTFIKFRTLYVDAKERFPELYAYQYSDSELSKLHFKVNNDPRVTPQGRWLRKSTLDEIPNFWCVFTGQMALVGPRPEIPEMLPYYHGEMLKKFSVRPGITGLAQISGRGNLSFYETVDYDLEYVNNKSVRLDIKILFKTVLKLFGSEGAF